MAAAAEVAEGASLVSMLGRLDIPVAGEHQMGIHVAEEDQMDIRVVVVDQTDIQVAASAAFLSEGEQPFHVVYFVYFYHYSKPSYLLPSAPLSLSATVVVVAGTKKSLGV